MRSCVTLPGLMTKLKVTLIPYISSSITLGLDDNNGLQRGIELSSLSFLCLLLSNHHYRQRDM
jgi:hypothetical protein